MFNIKQNIKWILLTLWFITISTIISAQNIQTTILSPQENEVWQDENLLIAFSVDEKYTIDDNFISISLNGININGNIKINKNNLNFVYLYDLPNDDYIIEIDYKLKGVNGKQNISWTFKKIRVRFEPSANNITENKSNKYSFSGSLVADNRTQFLSGVGSSLRQEPGYTRSISLNATARVNNIQIPIRYFTTSDNRFTSQNRNFIQTGLLSKHLDLLVGDINPEMDRLILSGVRMRGAKLAIKFGAQLVQLYYGTLTNPSDGLISRYNQGDGFPNGSFLNDSTIIKPGIYKRNLMAARIDLGSRSEVFRFGLNLQKIADDSSSIKHGLSPSENIAGGFDIGLALFKKKLQIKAGGAFSVLTKNTSLGVLTKEQADTIFKTKLPFDPVQYQQIIVLNSSTIPLNANFDNFTAYFTSLSHSTNYHQFFIEYKKNGPQFYSLGNPFLQNNYNGFNVIERVNFWKRRINLNLNYQNYQNNLGANLLSTIHNQIYNASLFFNINQKLPSLLVYGVYQTRNALNYTVSSGNINEFNKLFNVSLNYTKKIKTVGNNFRVSVFYNERKDWVRPSGSILYYNYVASFGQTLSNRITTNFEYGNIIQLNYLSDKMSDINTYSAMIDWEILESKLFSGISFSNNHSRLYSIFNTSNNRFSVIGKLGYVFYKNMRFDVEYGYQPYIDNTNSNFNYQDSYVYIRYVYDFNY